MSHEFRTPLNAQLALTRLLLDRLDGDLTTEQEKQVRFIRKAAESLLELVNDLLDLAKIEAGKIEVYPVEFQVSTLFSALRGMLRPLFISEAVELVFEEPVDIPPLYTDEGKVSQILRNFLSNALKFTQHGEVRIAATLSQDQQTVCFTVTDTGIGIAPEDQARIFEEFTQVAHPLQKRVKGTGLGLPLCRKLAELLGGSVAVESTVGVGSTFTAALPVVYQTPAPTGASSEVAAQRAGAGQAAFPAVLIIEDSEEWLSIYQKYLTQLGFHMLAARSLRDARRTLEQMKPQAIILDILLRGEDTWRFLAELKADPTTSTIPVLVVTEVEDQQKGLALGADAYCVKPVELTWLSEQLWQLVPPPVQKILVIDDQEAARYLLQKLLDSPDCQVLTATNGVEGVRLAQTEQPQLICLDLAMPILSGWAVLHQLRADPALQVIPVIVITSMTLTDAEVQQLEAQRVEFVTKAQLSRATLWAAIHRSIKSTAFPEELR
jgi:DNA-binding response OmpR family regulator/anti-sigma regulatory factor (Ser/Thr protein kinase)